MNFAAAVVAFTDRTFDNAREEATEIAKKVGEAQGVAIGLQIQGAMNEVTNALLNLGGTVTSLNVRAERAEERRVHFSVEVQAAHERFIHTQKKGLCPCCDKTPITSQDGSLNTAFGHSEHMYDAGIKTLHRTWLTCIECHRLKETNLPRFEAKFKAYQSDLEQFMKGQGPQTYPAGTLFGPR